MKFHSIAVLTLAAAFALPAINAVAADAKPSTVASLYKDKAGLAGKTVSAQGKVVKVNNGIMGRNFLHVQDGSGKAADGNNDLIVTSTQTAAVGDQVTISGVVVLNRDFGAGYSYPLLIEQATITRK